MQHYIITTITQTISVHTFPRYIISGSKTGKGAQSKTPIHSVCVVEHDFTNKFKTIHPQGNNKWKDNITPFHGLHIYVQVMCKCIAMPLHVCRHHTNC